MVTGSGFDFIQTAVMKVRGNNMTAVEVCVSAASSFLLLLILPSLILASIFNHVLFLLIWDVWEPYFICDFLSP